MKNNKALIIVLAVLIAALVIGSRLYTLYADPDDAASLTGGADAETAPDFTVYDADGNAVSLSDYLGTPVVLNFWASWCGPCRSEMGDIDAAYAEYGNEVAFLIVNLTDGSRETQSSAQRYIDGEGYAFAPLFDLESDAASAYSVRSIPASYFIGADGGIVSTYRGAMSADALESGIAGIIE